MSTINANFLIFDGNNIATLVSGLDVLAIDPYRQPKRGLSILPVARSNKRKANSAFWKEKQINARVCIKQTNRDATERSIDDLIALLQGVGKELWVPQSGTTRKYFATLSDVVPIADGTAYWEATLVFELDDSYGYDTAYTQILNVSGVTSSTRSDQYNFEGSADFQAPIIIVQYTATNTGGTSATALIGNAATGQQISISRNFAATDRIEVDCQNETVKVNGVEVAFTGAFPKFKKGLGNLTYSDNMTSRTFNYQAYYYKRWA